MSDSGQNVTIVDPRLDQRVLIKAEALDYRSVEIASQIAERIGVFIDNAHVAPVIREHAGQLGPHATAPDYDDVAHISPFTVQRPFA